MVAEVALAAAAANAVQAPWWATLVAALLGGLIGSAITASVAITTARAERRHDRQMRKEERDAAGAGEQRAERRDAYAALLRAAALLMNTGDAFRQTMAVRSGL